MKDLTVTLSDKTDAYSYYLGAPIEIRFTDQVTEWAQTGFISRHEARRLLRRLWLRRVWRRMTWWRYPPSVVVAIDHEHGSVTLASTRWSWSRWKWVRI